MQMKRKLSFEMHTGSELYKVLRQFVSRFCKNDKRDMRYILVTRSESSRKITIILKRILDAIRYAGDDNIAEFSKEEEKILCEIKKMISSILIEESISSFNEKKIIEFLKKTFVEILDIEEGEIYEKIVLLLLDSKVNRNAKILWNVLVADSLQHASQRRLVLTKELKKQLLPYCNELKEFSPLKDIIVEATGNIDVHKDYILVENNKELHSILELSADKMESLLLIELYRFEGGRKKENIRYWVPDQMTFAQDIKCKLIYRCSTRDRMIDYINSERLDEDTIIYFPTMAPNELTEQEDMYQKLLENRINSKEVCRCINCGRIIGKRAQ